MKTMKDLIYEQIAASADIGNVTLTTDWEWANVGILRVYTPVFRMLAEIRMDFQSDHCSIRMNGKDLNGYMRYKDLESELPEILIAVEREVINARRT